VIYFYSKTNEMHQFLKFILFCTSTLHVSDGLSVHRQEYKTVHTASGICQTDSAYCLLAGTPTSSQQNLYYIRMMLYEGGLNSSRPNNEKNEFIILNLFLFFNIISLKTNTFIPAMLQFHYPIPVVILRKICKIPLYSCNCLLIRRKTLTNEEEF